MTMNVMQHRKPQQQRLVDLTTSEKPRRMENDMRLKIGKALYNIKDADRRAYMEALRQCPQVVAAESEPLAFRRSYDAEENQARMAALRLLSYWTQRLLLFGNDAFKQLYNPHGIRLMQPTDRRFMIQAPFCYRFGDTVYVDSTLLHPASCSRDLVLRCIWAVLVQARVRKFVHIIRWVPPSERPATGLYFNGAIDGLGHVLSILPFEIHDLLVCVLAQPESHPEVALSLVPGVLEVWGVQWARQARVLLGSTPQELGEKIGVEHGPAIVGGQYHCSYNEHRDFLQLVKDTADDAAAKSLLP